MRHQVVIDTLTGYFTTTFEITITSAKTFRIDGKTHRLGHPAGVYRLSVSGKLTQQAPPFGVYCRCGEGAGVEVVEMD